MKDRRNINLWVGIWNSKIIGPEELPERLNGENYLYFLENGFLDHVEEQNISEEEIESMWFQYDGAPAYWYGDVLDELDEMFPGKWIGRFGPIAWPARSPDLNELDFFFWGYMKERIYSTPYNDFDELRNRIQEAVDSVTPEMLERVHKNFIKRCRACIQAQGGKFEHFLKCNF